MGRVGRGGGRMGRGCRSEWVLFWGYGVGGDGSVVYDRGRGPSFVGPLGCKAEITYTDRQPAG